MKKIDVSINVTAHTEGLLLYKSLRGVAACREAAEDAGIKTEVNISLDTSDGMTVRYAEQYASEHVGVNIYRVEFGDPAASRNVLISKSMGKYVAFFDGDDFFGEEYLVKAYQFAEKSKTPAVYVAELIVYFGAENVVKRSLDQNSPLFHPVNLFETNYFVSSNFVSRSIYEKIQYQNNGSGYGMEDWHWNTRVINEGFKFYNIPGTIFFYRRSAKNSMLHRHLADKVTLHESPFFLPKNFIKQPTYKITQSVSSIPEVASLKRNLKKNTVKILRKVMSNQSIPYRYLREQYYMNRGYAAALKASVKQKGQPSVETGVNPDFYFDTSNTDTGWPERLTLLGLNEEHIRQWAKLNDIEPMIRPSKGILDTIEIAGYLAESPLSLAYHKFCKDYGNSTFTDVLLIPHLVRGGADLAIINLVKALSQDLGKKVLVITTEQIESPWADKVCNLPGVELLEFYKAFAGLNDEQLQTFLMRFFQHWQPERLSIINSIFGYRLLENYGRQIRKHVKKVYMYTYAFDMTPDGYLFNAIPNGLIDTNPFIDLYITDSKGYKKQLSEINGFEANDIREMYLPIESVIKPKINAAVTKKVLWASRISPAKLMEVAVEIGLQLKEQNIELHFYGSLDAVYELGDKFTRMIAKYGNIKYHGTYDGFSSLPINDYDIFLLTSKNEGMPNVILEAIMANLFIVAPTVGGIPEVIKDGKNGFLVNDKFNAGAYADLIKVYYRNPELQKLEPRLQTNRAVIKQHDWEAFVGRVKELY